MTEHAGGTPGMRDRTVLDLARHASLCLLTLANGKGPAMAHPMVAQRVLDDGQVWFLIDITGAAAREISAHPQVNLAFTSEARWLTISGRATIVSATRRIHQLWDSAADALFPTGPDDPRVGLLHVQGRSARCWDDRGGIAVALSFLKARANGVDLREPEVEPPAALTVQLPEARTIELPVARVVPLPETSATLPAR